MSAVDLHQWPWIDHPQAGRALLVARQWLRAADDAHGVDAFDLVQCCHRVTVGAGGAPGEVLTMLADADAETAAAALGLGLKLLRFERMEALALSLGVSVQLQPHMLAEFEKMRRALQRKDGAQ